MLVVIAIIAILAAILFPVFAQARAKARQSACLSNCKQIGIGLLAYSQDYDEQMVNGWYGDGGYQASNNKANGQERYKWMDAIEPQVKNTGVFQCPDVPVGISQDAKGKYIPARMLGSDTTSNGNADDRWYGSYAINSAYWSGDTNINPASKKGPSNGQSLAAVQNPAGTIWVMDGNGSYQVSWPDINADPEKVIGTGSPKFIAWNRFNTIDQDPIKQEGAMIDRHQGQSNAIYCDGHAKNVALSYLISPDQRTRNADGSLNPNGFLRQFTPADD